MTAANNEWDRMPRSLDAEKGALASMLLDPKVAISESVSTIRPEYFCTPANVVIYGALVEMWTEGLPIDLITLTQFLSDRGILESVGGAAYVTELFVFIPTAANVQYYLEILTDKFTLRQIIAVCAEATKKCYLEQEDVPMLLCEVKDNVAAIMTEQTKQRKSISELVSEKITRMELGQDDLDILHIGLEKLDHGSPLHKGDMPILSGEAKSGKTIFALSIAKNVAARGVGVGFFSLESTVHEAVDRLLAGVARIPMTKLGNAVNLTPGELDVTTRAASTLSLLPIYLYDDVFDLHHVIAEARRLKAQRNIGLLIVDYAQLVRTKIQKDRNREQEVASISRALRLLSLQLKVPLILLSQLNEENRSRESRALEQDCTAHWMITKIKDEPNLRDIQIPYQRNGESGIFARVTFLGHIGRVETYVDSDVVHVGVPVGKVRETVIPDRLIRSHLDAVATTQCKTGREYFIE